MSERFRLVSANLGRADPGTVKDLIGRLNADLAAVQELAPRQAAALAEVLPFGHLRPMAGGRGMGIALRKPGSVTHVPLPFRGGWSAEIVPAGASVDPVEILNVHIPRIRLPPWRSLALRRAQLCALLAYLDGHPRRRRVVVGDLNSTPLWPAYRLLARRFEDAVATAARREGRRAPRTWRPSSRLPWLLRIDHVLTTGLTAHQVRALPILGSDHCAVVIDLYTTDGVPTRADWSQGARLWWAAAVSRVFRPPGGRWLEADGKRGVLPSDICAGGPAGKAKGQGESQS
jgi:endonuclease/exonuclease/phosphatase (EEP) superfamily protein YafD